MDIQSLVLGKNQLCHHGNRIAYAEELAVLNLVVPFKSLLFPSFLRYVVHIFIVVQSPSCVRLFATPWTVAHQVSLFFTISQSMLILMPLESVIPSNHLILCHLLLLLPSIFPSIRVLSSESALCIRWPKYWSFSFSICPSNDYSD